MRNDIIAVLSFFHPLFYSSTKKSLKGGQDKMLKNIQFCRTLVDEKFRISHFKQYLVHFDTSVMYKTHFRDVLLVFMPQNERNNALNGKLMICSSTGVLQKCIFFNILS